MTSSTIVTGPSFASSTSMLAPNDPVSTSIPSAQSASQEASYSGSAWSGGAAPVTLGGSPFAVLSLSGLGASVRPSAPSA